MASPGQIAGRYEIRQTLGRGGMGVVYKAWDPVLRREVALKTIRDTASENSVQLFFKECDVLASISHPNIVEIFDVGELEEDGEKKPYFVMPFLNGQPLDKLIGSPRLTPERAAEIIAQTCRGLQAAHERGLIHRDLKPSNIFVMDDDSVKVIDFGVARMGDAHSTVGLKGTLRYMSPEQIEMKNITPLSDLFSLGVLCYEMLTGRRPFDRPNEPEIVHAVLHEAPVPASDLNPSINQWVSRVIHKALAKQPYHRFATAREFSEALQKAFRNEPLPIFDPVKIQPRVQRATRAHEQGDYQFALEILNELEAEGHLDPAISTLHRQVDAAMRRKTIFQLLESARTRIEEDEYPLALQKIQEALALDADNPDALALKRQIEEKRASQKIDDWLRLARQHIDNYAYSHARAALNNARGINPNEPRVLQMIAEMDRKEQEYMKIRQEKQSLYRSALEAFEGGEVSSALTKMERVVDLDRKAPDTSSPDGGAIYQNLYNRVRSEHDAIRGAYAEARRYLADRNFSAALSICSEYLIRHPGHALFQALKMDVEEAERQEISARIAEFDRRVAAEAEPQKRVEILEEAVGLYPNEPHFQRALRLARDKRDLTNSIVSKARLFEERGQFSEALAQWEIMQTVYSGYPGLEFEIERLFKRRDQQLIIESKTRWVEQVENAIEAKEYERALHALEAAQAEFPGDAELQALETLARQGLDRGNEAQRLLEAGKKMCAGGRFDEGLESIRKANDLDPRGPARGVLVETLTNRARALVDSDWATAEKFATQALDLDFDHAPARSLQTLAHDRKRELFVTNCIARARQLQAAGDLPGAFVEVDDGLKTYPNDARLGQLRAVLARSFQEPQPQQQPAETLRTGVYRSAEEVFGGPPAPPSRQADLAELERLDAQLRSTEEAATQRLILEQAHSIVSRYPGDQDLAAARAQIEQLLALVKVRLQEEAWQAMWKTKGTGTH